MFVFGEGLWLVRPGHRERVFFFLLSLEAIQLAPWSTLAHVRGCHCIWWADLGLRGPWVRTSFVNGRVCGVTRSPRSKSVGRVLLFTFFFFLSFLAWRHPVGVNAADAGACACARHACAAGGGRDEVQECEIRRWFVEGDNEQSAIFAGWALMCKPQSRYTLSDFNHIKLLFFLLIIPKERLSSHLSAKDVDNRVSLFTWWWKTIPSLPW